MEVEDDPLSKNASKMLSALSLELVEPEKHKRRATESPGPKHSKQIKVESDISPDLSNHLGEVPDFLEARETKSNDDISKQYTKFKNAPKFNLNSEEVFCVCRMPDHGGKLMISCDGCDEWFHFTCMKMSQKYSKLIDKFYCKFCEWKGIGMTRFKRKCRISDCYEPIRADIKSKYCSDSHATAFIDESFFKRKNDNGLSSPEVKSVLDYCSKQGGGYEKLIKMGTFFPEIPDLQKNAQELRYTNMAKDYSDRLKQIDERLKNANESIEYFKLKNQYLLRVKEKVKLFNEILQNDAVLSDSHEDAKEKSSKKGKSKSKKVDICFYDRTLGNRLDSHMNDRDEMVEFVQCEDLSEYLKNQIVDLRQFYRINKDKIDKNCFFDDSLCMRDKRKCLRHNGWWNLINDQVIKKSNEFSELERRLKDEKFKVLRDYSIKLYEGDV